MNRMIPLYHQHVYAGLDNWQDVVVAVCIVAMVSAIVLALLEGRHE